MGPPCGGERVEKYPLWSLERERSSLLRQGEGEEAKFLLNAFNAHFPPPFSAAEEEKMGLF